jgi:hypothetical protein
VSQPKRHSGAQVGGRYDAHAQLEGEPAVDMAQQGVGNRSRESQERHAGKRRSGSLAQVRPEQQHEGGNQEEAATVGQEPRQQADGCGYSQQRCGGGGGGGAGGRSHLRLAS